MKTPPKVISFTACLLVFLFAGCQQVKTIHEEKPNEIINSNSEKLGYELENSKTEIPSEWQTYKNEDFGIQFEYPFGWYVFVEGDYIGVQNQESRFNKSNLSENLKLFWLVINYDDEKMSEEQFLQGSDIRYENLQRQIIDAKNTKINFYEYFHLDCGLRVRAFWSYQSSCHFFYLPVKG